ncbi:MAG: hypothetical protein QXO07_02700 [Candidatus Aenigmatarchaeota archaeon]
MMDTLYVKIKNYPKIKREILEVKKNIYLDLHSIIEDITRKEKEEEELNKILVKIGEATEIIDNIVSLLPPKEEIEKLEEEKKEKSKKSKKKSNTEIVEDQKRDYIKEELNKIEEELRRIQEELLKLARQ